MGLGNIPLGGDGLASSNGFKGFLWEATGLETKANSVKSNFFIYEIVALGISYLRAQQKYRMVMTHRRHH